MKQIQYQNEIIEYEIVRANIKNLYIKVKEGKVTIKAPLKLKESKVLEFIEKKKKWIYQNVKKTEQRKDEKNYTKEEYERLESILKPFLGKYTKLMKQHPNKVRIRNIKCAWGSCSSKKNITFNVKLVDQDTRFIEYVVVHELCHLQYMNHSNCFWNLVSQWIPDYKERKKLIQK